MDTGPNKMAPLSEFTVTERTFKDGKEATPLIAESCVPSSYGHQHEMENHLVNPQFRSLPNVEAVVKLPMIVDYIALLEPVNGKPKMDKETFQKVKDMVAPFNIELRDKMSPPVPNNELHPNWLTDYPNWRNWITMGDLEAPVGGSRADMYNNSIDAKGEVGDTPTRKIYPGITWEIVSAMPLCSHSEK